MLAFSGDYKALTVGNTVKKEGYKMVFPVAY